MSEIKKENTVYKLYLRKINVLNNEWHEFTTETGCILGSFTESQKETLFAFDKR